MRKSSAFWSATACLFLGSAAITAVQSAETQSPATAPTTNAATSTAPSSIAAIEHGAKLFKKNCLTCHDPKLPQNDPRNLTDGVWHKTKTRDEVKRVTEEGLGEKMPAFKGGFRPGEIEDVVTYLWAVPPKETKQ